jgi:hypothetical protein
VPRCPVFLLLGITAACSAAESVDEGGDGDCPRVLEDLRRPVEDPPDGAAACPEGSCNYQTQNGCDDDQGCRPQLTPAALAVEPACEAAGSAAAGEPCAEPSDCARGTYCANGVCRKLCCGADWSACDAGESCIRQLSLSVGGQSVEAGVDLCFPVGTCGLFDPESCAEEDGRECKIVDPTGAVACAPVSTKDVGDLCGSPEVCAQGLTCVGGFCIKLCAAEACGEPRCGRGEGTCVHFARNPPGVGECTLGR